MNVNGQAPSTAAMEDAELARRVARGDLTAFGLLYDRYAHMVHTLATCMLGSGDADEMVQESFLRLWLNADQFDARRGSFRAWFMAIARHRIVRELETCTRQQRLNAASDVDRLLASTPDPAVDVEGHVWRRAEASAIAESLRLLPPEQRQVIVLAYFGGLSQSAIAESLGIPLGTVKKRTRLGLQKLRRALSSTSAPLETQVDDNVPEARTTDEL